MRLATGMSPRGYSNAPPWVQQYAPVGSMLSATEFFSLQPSQRSQSTRVSRYLAQVICIEFVQGQSKHPSAPSLGPLSRHPGLGWLEWHRSAAPTLARPFAACQVGLSPHGHLPRAGACPAGTRFNCTRFNCTQHRWILAVNWQLREPDGGRTSCGIRPWSRSWDSIIGASPRRRIGRRYQPAASVLLESFGWPGRRPIAGSTHVDCRELE